MTFDPRLTPARPDLAADFLKGVVDAPTYAKGQKKRVGVPVCPLRGKPDEAASLATELLFGETFSVYEEKDGWSWGQASLDDYVGYAPSTALETPGAEPSHMIAVLRSFIYPGPDLKAPVTAALSLGSLATIKSRDGDFMELEGSGFVFAEHLRPVSQFEPDYVTTAVRFMGAPYLWGGRSSLGVDCSGLVQLALGFAGINVPRDTDMQAKGIGEEVEPDLSSLQSGDLVFFPGHVGVMLDGQTLLHANAWDMMVSPHPLRHVVAQIAKKEAEPLTCVRRYTDR